MNMAQQLPHPQPVTLSRSSLTLTSTQPSPPYLWFDLALTFAHTSPPFLRKVKAVLSGVVLPDSLSLRTLLVKPLALALALGSSLSIGKEGAMVHTCCCLAQQLCESPLLSFNRMRIEERRVELMVAAAAVGVVCTFGAPVGGVLFSIEITSSYYMLEHLSFAFCTATLSLVWTAQLLLIDPSHYHSLKPFSASLFNPRPFTPGELCLFAVLGASMGLLAHLLTRCVSLAYHMKTALLTSVHPKLGFALPPLVAASCAAFYLAIDQGGCRGSFSSASLLLNTLFALHTPLHSHSPHHGNASYPFNTSYPSGNSSPSSPSLSSLASSTDSISTLVLFAGVKLLLLTPFSLVLATPTGVFLPTFMCGAALGRAYAIALLSPVLSPILSPLLSSPDWHTTLPQCLALAGAAAMTTASTRTLSTAVIALELSGQLALQPPLFVCGMAAFLVVRALDTPSLFDLFSRLKALPGATTSGPTHPSVNRNDYPYPDHGLTPKT